MTVNEIKEHLLKACHDWLYLRFDHIEAVLKEIKNALEEETKSSAGDKHETGRAMLQIERENAGRQLAEAEKVRDTLDKVDVSHASDHAHLGSLVFTSHGDYYLSISTGAIEVDGKQYFAIAPKSPVGALLLGKEEGDVFTFHDEEYKIISVE